MGINTDLLGESGNDAHEAKVVLQNDVVVACTERLLTLFHCTREDMLGRSFLNFSAPTQESGEGSAESLALRTVAALTDRRQQFEWLCRRPNRTVFVANATLSRLQTEGRVLAQLVLTPTGVMGQDEAEPSRLKLGIENSDHAIFMTDLDGTIIFTNPGFQRLYGYRNEEALGNTPRILKSGVLPRKVYQELWRSLKAKKAITTEIINKTKDGRLIHVEGSNSPVLDGGGNLIGYLGIHRDISERKNKEAESQSAHEGLESQVRELTLELDKAQARLKEHFAALELVEEALTHHNKILGAMSELSQQTSGSLELQPLLEKVIEITSQLIHATSAHVSEIDLASKATKVVAEYVGPEASDAERASDMGTEYTLHVYSSNDGEEKGRRAEPYVIHVDDRKLPASERAHMRAYGAKSILSIPLFVQVTPVAEVNFCESRRKREFTAEEIEMAQAITRQVAVPIENARLYDQAMREIKERSLLEQRVKESFERRGRQVQLSTQLTKAIVAATDLNDLYQRVVSQVKEQFGYYHAQLLRYEPVQDAVVLIAGYGVIGARMLAAGHRMPLGVGLIGIAAQTRRSVLRPDITNDPDWQPNPLLSDTQGELAVPIVLGDQLLGVLDVQSNVTGALNDDDQLALEGLCGQIAIAIESTRLRQEMTDRLRELNELQRIMSHEGWQAFRAQHKSVTKGYRYDQSTVQSVAIELPSINNVTPPDEKGHVASGNDLPNEDMILASMTVRGEVIGAITVQEDPDHPLVTEDRELLESISTQVAEALESARLLEQTQKHAIEMEAVAQVSAAASTILDADRLLHTVVSLTRERFDLYHVAIFVLADDRLHLASGTELKASAGDGELAPELRLSDQHSLVARAARGRQPVGFHDILKEPGYIAYPQLPGTRAELAIPLIVGEKVLGVLDLQSDVANRFGEDDVRIHTTLGAQVAVALQNATLYAEQLQTAARLREVDRLKSEFLASMSHELRTPLNSIIGFGDVLLEGLDGPLNDRMEEDVTLIRDSGRHLRHLIGELLDMSKIEAGQMELYYEQVSVPALAKEIVANAKSLALHKDLDIRLNLDPALDDIEADRTRLTQILLNLVSNAVKFTESGSVTLSLSEQNGSLLAAVEDTGIGIKKEDIPIIFEQFRQVDGSLTRKVGGTGLGIPISKRLIELHGGDLQVESEPGVGSTFRFTIPKKQPAAKQ